MFGISFMVLVPGAVQNGVKCMAGWLLVHCVRYLVQDALHMVDYHWCLAFDAVYLAFGELGGPPLKPGAWLLMQFTWRCISGPAPTEASVRPWASHRSPFWCNTV